MKKLSLIIITLLLLTSCKANTYTVTFVDNNETILTANVKKGENLSNIEKPTKDGYIFLGWLKDGFDYNMDNPINEDMTLEASWVETPNPIKTYTISFNFGNEIRTISVKEGEKVTKPKAIPKKEKHKFIGWYDGDTLYDFNSPVTKDFVLTAKFEKSRLTIKYDLDGGTGTIEVEIEKGTIPDKPKNPSKFGYTFTNWTINNETYNFDKPLDSDTTIKANYEANVYYKVTFDTVGGNEINSQMIISGNKLETIPTPTKEGYTFLYWEYNGEEFNKDMEITEDIILIAKYEETSE